MHRRQLLRSALGATAFGLVSTSFGTAFAQDTVYPAGVVYDPPPFGLGVASGSPLPDRVIIWTKLTGTTQAAPLTADFTGLDQVEEVVWQVAEDAAFARVVASGSVAATPDLGYAVHVDVEGLSPSTHYFYRFGARGVTSVIGRTKTAPAPDANPGVVKVAHASCQAFGSGMFPLWGHVAREDLDLVLHLGDYMYEGGGSGLEGHRSHTYGDPQDLTDYRRRYAVYRGDPMMRWAHAAHPFAVTWDDHEVYNDYSGGANKTSRKHSAWQAWYEHMPVRAAVSSNAVTGGFEFQLHHAMQYGTLVDIPVLDLRQHRVAAKHIEAAGLVFPGSEGLAEQGSVYDDPSATILGAQQKQWLKDRLVEHGDKWSLWGNSIAILQMRNPSTLSLTDPANPAAAVLPINHYWWPDQWDGYNLERQEVLGFMAEEGIRDMVAVTGDFHAAWVSGLRPNFQDPSQPYVGVEFVGHSVTSSPYGVPASMVEAHEHVKWQDSSINGYSVVEVTPETMTNHFVGVTNKNQPASSTTYAVDSWSVDRGTAMPYQNTGVGRRPTRDVPALPAPGSAAGYGA